MPVSAILAESLLPTLRKEFVHKADLARDRGKARSEPADDRFTGLEHESAVLSGGDERLTWLESELSPERRWHHETSLGPNDND